ncbi:MAG: hypothetical protein ACE5HD_08555 [Acidobacteriota bacterium]
MRALARGSARLLPALLTLAAAAGSASAGIPAQEPSGLRPGSSSNKEKTITLQQAPTPRVESKTLGDQEPVPPLLEAMHDAVMFLPNRDCSRKVARALGSSLFTSYARYYKKDRLAALVKQFKEGYYLSCIQLPEAVSLTTVEMKTEETAKDLYRINIEMLQMEIDATDQSEEGHAEVLDEDDIRLASLDQAFEKRYNLILGDTPPTRFLVLFGRKGRYLLTVFFLQSDVDRAKARRLLETLGTRVAATSSGQTAHSQ